ncbi:MAG TPA: PAS domain-containing protein [Bryobacteraceae bacterium]|nr:PAS domain-containing protein [Bryobacteraceae bacterium]
MRRRIVTVLSHCSRLFQALLILAILGGTRPATAQVQSPLGEVRKLGPEKPGSARPIRVHGVITAFSGWKNSFFLQDASGAISIDRQESAPVQIGDEIDLTGRVQPGLFAPIILSQHIDIVRTATLPEARPVSYRQLVTGSLDSTRVTVTGVIRSAKIENIWGRNILRADLQTDGGSIAVHVLNFTGQDAEDLAGKLVDSEVRIAGVAGTIFNDNQQLVGIRLFAPRLTDIEILKPAPEPSVLPVSPIAKLLRFGQDGAPAHRVRIEATVTYDPPEHVLYLQDQTGAMRIADSLNPTFTPGARVSVLGFVSPAERMPTLVNTTITPIGRVAEPQPVSIEASQLVVERDGFTFTPYEARLVRLQGTVVDRLASSRGELWRLRSGSRTFQMLLAGTLPAGGIGFEAGTQLLVTGICTTRTTVDGAPSTRILLRSIQDVQIVRSAYSSVALLFLVLLAAITGLGMLAVWYFQKRVSVPLLPQRDMQPIFQRRARILIFAAALVVLAVCVLELSGSSILNTRTGLVGPSTVLMLLAAIAGLLAGRERRTGWQLFPAIVLFFGIAGCIEQLTGITLGIAALLHRILPLTPQPGRMPLATAFAAVLTGSAILLVQSRRAVALAHGFAVLTSVFSLFDFLIRLYGASLEYRLTSQSVMSAPTALCFYLLSLAILFESPRQGLMRVVSASGPGGITARRLLPAGLLIPVALGWLRLQGQLHSFYDTFFGLALFALANALVFSFLIWSSAGALERSEEARTAAESETRERERRLEKVFRAAAIGDFSWNAATDQVTAHPMVWALYGEPGREGSGPGSWFRARQHPADVQANKQATDASFATGKPLDIEFRVLWPSGEMRWVACKATVTYDEARRPVGLNGVNFDITERKLAELARVEASAVAARAEQQLATGLDLSEVALWSWTPENDCVSWTGPVEQVFGKPAEKLPSFGAFRSIVFTEDLPELEAKLRRSLAGTGEYRAEFRITTPGGKTRWIAGRGDVLRNEKQQIIGMAGVNFDITASKHAELGLARSERELREMADAMPQIVWTAGADGNVQQFNRRWYEYTGTSRLEEALSVIHPDDLDRYQGEWREAFLCGVLFECEVRLRRSDGVYRWHLSRAVPVRNQAGAVMRWFGTSTDVENYKQLEARILGMNSELERRVEERSAQLAESERRYRQLVEGVKDYAIFMLDRDGRIATWNAGAERLKGYQAEEIIGRHFSIFYPEDVAASGHPAFELEFAATHDQYSEQGWRIRKDGSRFWADILITAIRNSDGELTGFSKITRDLSDQKKIEDLLIEERERAESANEAKSSFLAAMSHEIRTPMNAILGMADLLWDTNLDPAQREYVGRFRRAGSTLLTLINDILDLSKIESGRFELEQTDFALEDTIERTMELVVPRAKAKQISAAARIEPGTCTALSGDPARLQQILLNLLGNAVKFTSQGGVTLEVRQRPAESAVHLEFTVIDTGVGIPADKLASIFEDFTQAESSTTRRFGGTGLGLGIARRLIHRMGGQISVESTPGAGSTFRFDAIFGRAENPIVPARDNPPAAFESGHTYTLSHAASTPAQYTNAAQPVAPEPPLRVLVADDSEDNRFLIAAYLDKSRYALTFVENGLDAIARRKSQNFDLILMDMHMPLLDGLSATKAIRAWEREQEAPEVPVIALTANALVEDAARSYQAGCNGHLSKPISKARLIEAVEGYRSARFTEQLAGLAASGSGSRQRKAPEIPIGLEAIAHRYLAARREELIKIEALIRQRNFAELRTLGHNMKGSGESFGFDEITWIGEAIEAAAKREDLIALQRHLRDLRDYVAFASESVLPESPV